MLSPKKVKRRKIQKGRMKGMSARGNYVTYGTYGLKAMEPGWITSRQIEATRVSISRRMKHPLIKKVITRSKNYLVHYIGSEKLVGPGMLGVYARAAERTSLSTDDYLTQSIRYPGEFLVEGYENLMPTTFEGLSDTDIKDLIAYLKTLE